MKKAISLVATVFSLLIIIAGIAACSGDDGATTTTTQVAPASTTASSATTSTAAKTTTTTAKPTTTSAATTTTASEVGERLAANRVLIPREDFGEDWPFTVEEGVLKGDGSGGVGEITFTADGVTYAVNGTAKGTHKYTEIDAIWADNPSMPGAKINIGPIIDLGLELMR